ncbi:ComEC/Rec2 family competence protein [Lyngbya sp. CCY1209]|uniref:ComEC/Rec2 family competence protein n=1 Tax=Lyngbya sp. CCY1209 TaxID=2886103 RepID=UPI002D202397|nr:ComEC/Rec2 family competence protein [Lyngbya sp. CCY1209]MEB3886155.1 ComEC/Rec2 family competence protein [Lyngbya sp. CCY1209]
MNQTAAIALGLAYILGLLVAPFPWGGYVLLGVGVGMAVLTTLWQYQLRRRRLASSRRSKTQIGRKRGSALAPPPEAVPRPPIQPMAWLGVGLVGVLAPLYFQMQTPEPAPDDISQYIVSGGKVEDLLITVRGKVEGSPRLTRSGNTQFWLRTREINEITSTQSPIEVSKPVSGKLYVTVPVLQGTGLHPNETVAVTGTLYTPQAALNPGGFDFRRYLARRGAFAGMYGRYLVQKEEQAWGWWRVRQRILRAQVYRLGVPKGTLLAGMVLGRRAVDLPPDIGDRFVEVGLAHTLAASGFHVSLLLGVILALTVGLAPGLRLGIGAIALLFYVGLTGGSPSVLRAALMGVAALVGLVMDRRVRPLAVLLGVAVLLLLWNPLLIHNLGFQFSFLATFGLLVTVPPLMRSLRWLPPVIATGIAVPVAAAVWTLPLQIYVFNLVSPYSILVNILAVPFVTLITLGGMLTALVALVWPWGASQMALALYYPLQGLISMVEWFGNLPGNSVAVGGLSLVQLIALYCINVAMWAWGSLREARSRGKQHRRRRSIGFYPVAASVLVAIAIVAVPVAYAQFTQFRVTVLAAADKPILVVQDRDRVLLLNSGDEKTVEYTILPFLIEQGVNQIDWAIATHPELRLNIGWLPLLEELPVRIFYDTPAPKDAFKLSADTIQETLAARNGLYLSLQLENPLELGATRVKLIEATIPVLELILGDRRWLLLGLSSLEDQSQLLTQNDNLSEIDILWWSGDYLAPDLLETLNPKVAIASSNTVSPETAQALESRQIQLFWTARDGALQWTPNEGFSPALTADVGSGE